MIVKFKVAFFLFSFFWINFVSLSFGYATVFIKCNCGFWGYLGMLIWWVWKKNKVVASSLVSVWLEYKLILVNVYGIIEHSLKTWYKFYIMLCVQSSLNESLTLDVLARFYLVISMWVRWIYDNNASVSAFFRFDSMNWFCMMSFFFLKASKTLIECQHQYSMEVKSGSVKWFVCIFRF